MPCARDNPRPLLNHDATTLLVTLLNLEVPLASAVTDPNAASVAEALDRVKLGATGDFAGVIREVTAMDNQHFNQALEILAGQVHASAFRMAASDSEVVTDLLRDVLSEREHASDEDSLRGRPSGGIPRKGRAATWIAMTQCEDALCHS
jgi:uncharacterized protein with beta-barrel porin domain